ncbi:MAG TPA: TolC family protein [Bryobacteraceae bacterium]|nr:TolC family protein [Bryobacteraceae bacterium]
MNGQIGGAPAQTPTPRAEPLPISGRQQSGAVVPVESPAAGAGAATSVNTINSTLQVQGSFQGSVATGTVSPQPLALTLQAALRRGMQYNLGAITTGNVNRQARAQRLAAIAQLLPDITGSVGAAVQQINLAAQGLRFNLPIAGFHFPSVVGPFNYFDAAANFNESVSLTGIRNWQSARQNERSAELSMRDARELVALAVAGSYLQILASAARIQTANAQIDTAQVVYRQAVDRNRSGLNARIDVNRSLVELQIQQQRLTSLTNEMEKQKLTLARLIGLPMAQAFTLADMIPFRELPAPDVNALIQQALSTRPDVQAAGAQVRAAELARSAAVAEYYPSLAVTADYGATGVNPSRQAHGTFLVAGSVIFPIFRSGRISADIAQADVALAQRRAEYEDTKGQAEQDVRTSALDLAAASQQVRVADSNRGLAAETLRQAQDRFRAGVADTIELVQAQESVATAEQDYISALYALNLAQVSLARAVGQTEQGVVRLVQGH